MSTNTQNNAPVSAEPVAWLEKLISLVVSYGDSRHFEVEAVDKRDAVCRTTQAFADLTEHVRRAPVAAQPDVTQQTLDDVKAGIPARDAEIEALQKRNKDLLVQAVEDIAVIHRLGCRLAEISEVVTPDVPLEQHDTADLLDRVKKAISAQAQPDAASIHLQDLKNEVAQNKELRQQISLLEEHARGECWRWQGDGTDDLSTMGNRMGVLIYACDLRALLAAQQPVSGADGVQYQGEPWRGWACQYPGKMPRLYGAKEIAAANHHPEEGDRLIFLSEQAQLSGNSGEFNAWIKYEYPHLGPIGEGVAIAREAWSAALAQQDADRMDAERYRAWRDAACKNDRTLIDAMFEYQLKHFREGNPTPEQFNAGMDYALAAIDAARKEKS
ncbi:hypothetical protein [Alcaligenes aquatilis]|uniref:hypothetical protein n=1 Tax=Alcaligenes aquatilis TaxID=323284 RepID=UPI003751EFC2